MSVSSTKKMDSPRRINKTDLSGKPENKNKALRYLAVLTDRCDLDSIVEVLGETAVLKSSTTDLYTMVIAGTEHTDLLKKTGLFNEVITITADRSVRKAIRKRKPDLLHVPHQGLFLDFYLYFAGKSLRIGSGRSQHWKKLFNFYDTTAAPDRKILMDKGVPAARPVNYRINDLDRVTQLPERYIWLNLYSLKKSSLKWSSAHAARLGRLVHREGVHLVIPSCHSKEDEKMDDDIHYLKTSGPGIFILESCTLEDRIRGMAGAITVIGVHGPEMVLAGLAGAPTLLLQTASQARSMEVASMAHDEIPDASGDASSYEHYFRFHGRSEKFLSPDSQKPCGSGCVDCENGPCIDKISPERVFEGLLPYMIPVN